MAMAARGEGEEDMHDHGGTRRGRGGHAWPWRCEARRWRRESEADGGGRVSEAEEGTVEAESRSRRALRRAVQERAIMRETFFDLAVAFLRNYAKLLAPPFGEAGL